MMIISVSLSVPIYITENRKKVEKCIFNLLGYLPELEEMSEKEYSVLRNDNINIESLKKFFDYIRQMKFLDTVRNCIDIDLIKNEIVINFHKQALYVNRIAVITSDTTPTLGNVQITIKTKNPQKLLDWLAPSTENGQETRKTYFGEIYKIDV